jgi:hypothetical protein
MAWTLLALVALDGVLTNGRARHVLAAGLCTAWALLAHQVALLVLVVALPILFAERCLGAQRSTASRLLAAGSAVVLGIALSAFTIVPFLARARYAMDLGMATQSLGEVTARLLELRSFARMSAVIQALGLIGGWLALRQARPGGVFIAGASAAFVLLSSNVLTQVLHLERVFPSVIKIEAPRMLLVAKLFWLPLVGHAAVCIWQGLGRLPLERLRRPGRVRSALRALLVAAIVLPPLPRIIKTEVIANVQGEAQTAYYADLQQAFAWAREQRQKEPGHYRVAYELDRDDHTSTLAPLYDHAPMYKIGDTPSQIFDGMPMTAGPEMLEALGVRYVVSRSRLDAPVFAHERSFGRLELHRFTGYRAEPFELVGPGKAELLELAPERLRVRLNGTRPSSRLRIHIAEYDRWQATVDGAQLPITTVPVHGAQDPVLMEVPARDGELRLEYVDAAPDRWGLVLTLAALPTFFAVLLLLRRVRALRSWLEELRLARRRTWLIGGLSIAIAVCVVPRLRDGSSLLPKRSIFHGQVQMSLGGQPCSARGGLSFLCGPHRVEAALVHGRGDHLCMTAPKVGTLRVRQVVQVGDFVAGRYDARGDQGWMEATLDGRALGWVLNRPAFMRAQSVRFDTRARAGQTAEIELTLAGGMLHCFDFWLV